MNDKGTHNACKINLEPDVLEPFKISPGFRIGNQVIVSGQAALDQTGAIVGIGDFDAQAKQVFENLRSVLEAADSSLAQVFKVTIYLTDMSHFPRVIELRGQYFSPPWPADTIVEVNSLALPELMIEIEAMAMTGVYKVAG